MTTRDAPSTAALALPSTPLTEEFLPRDAAGNVLVSADDVARRLQVYAKKFEIAMAPATVRAVRSDWGIYTAWCANAGCAPLKLVGQGLVGAERDAARQRAIDELEAFFKNAIARGLRRSTLDRYLYTIRLAHLAAGVEDPTALMLWKLAWKALTRSLKEAGRNRKQPAAPLKRDTLETVVPALSGPDADLRALRDAALLCLAADTLTRREELARAAVELLERKPDGTGTLEIPFSKTDPDGKGAFVHVSEETMQHVFRWLAAAGITKGPIFRSVRYYTTKSKERRVSIGKKAMNPQEVARIFKQRVSAAGLDAERISGHSTRVGATHDLMADGYPIGQIAKAGRWAGLDMVLTYTRELEPDQGAVADSRKKRPLPGPALLESQSASTRIDDDE